MNDVNGKIAGEPSPGNTVDVTAIKRGRGSSPDAAKAALDRVTIVEDVSPSRIRIDTKWPNLSGMMFNGGSVQVEYRVKVPAGAEVKFTTVNGGIDITGLQGRITAETTNGGVTTHDVGGQLEASTTNGGLNIDMSPRPEGGVKNDLTHRRPPLPPPPRPK